MGGRWIYRVLQRLGNRDGFFTILISIGQLGMATIIRHIYP